MALLHMDGFDRYGSLSDCLNYGGYISAGTVTFNTTGGVWGGGCVHIGTAGLNGGQDTILRPLGSPATELWSGYYFAINGDMSFSRSPRVVACFNSVIGYETWIGIYSNSGVITTSAGGGVTYPFALNKWYWVEVRAKLHASAGYIEVWIDGNQVLSVGPVNTKTNSAATGYVSISAGRPIFFYDTGAEMSIDDWVVTDLSGSYNNSRPGKQRIYTIYPSSDAGPNNGTPSTGTSHYACVDEAHIDTSDYITILNITDQAEVFGLTDLSAPLPSSIKGVKVCTVAKTSDGGTASGANVINSPAGGATWGTGASTGIGSSYSTVSSIFETDPNTSAAWTASAVNAMSAGFKIL
jgi:hypothetical protein